MQILMTILYVLLFIVFLSILIIIHELGHLAAAKAFHVYCLEYSIGMGPAIFKIKKKNWETQFSLRAIPFGGYVSMYGEGVELPEGVEIDESRSLNKIKAWKRAIVLLAGVTMNAVLALVFFFASNFFPKESIDFINHVNIVESSVAYNSGFKDGDIIKFDRFDYHDDVAKKDRIAYLADSSSYLDDDMTTRYATCFNFEALKNYKHLDYSEYIFVYKTKVTKDEENNDIYVPNFEEYVNPETFNKLTVHFTERVFDSAKNEYVDGEAKTMVLEPKEGHFDSFGMSIYYTKVQYVFGKGDIIKHTFMDFGNCSKALFETIGQLFTNAAAWEGVGGIISVGFETTSALQNFGFGVFLFYWGFISVNLAIFNLLPFPGLDGWQLLVLIVEGITRKKIPDKVKTIVSLVGIGLLLLLMGVVVVKDIIKYFFLGVSLL